MSADHFITQDSNGVFHLNLLVEGMHCPSCVALIEDTLLKQPEVTLARLNLSTKRLNLAWKGNKGQGDSYIALINSMGYRAAPFDPATSETFEKREEKGLLRALAVAGFASGNLMLFSIPLWTSDGVEMGEATRSFFHWIQAAIALPAIIYCGLPFYRSAWKALKQKHTNMDVPISIAVILATGMSLFETTTFGRHSYFDSCVMLLFFLLIGRYLEARAKGRARNAAHDLLQMMAGFATVLHDDGRQEVIPLSEIKPGMRLRVAAGEKIGADGTVEEGSSEIDTSLITGETMPRAVQKGSDVFAGMLNIAGPITVYVTQAGEHSLIAEIVRLMETAEQSQAKYVTLADHISGWYTPVVFALAAATFLGWLLLYNAIWQVALLYAATVLIITCPCALGLAVPVVQVLASGKLMRSGILLKSGSALERLATITHAIFDKTGTLTKGMPELLHPESYRSEDLQLAASLAAHSKHPLSQAVSRAWHGNLFPLQAVQEIPGSGIEAHDGIRNIRLGKASWCGARPGDAAIPEIWMVVEKEAPIHFQFRDVLREDAADVVHALKQEGIRISLLSGDREVAVKAVAQEVHIPQAQHSLSPKEKAEILQQMHRDGYKTLMVGDGLNDAPSLTSATISMSPASAMDITQNAADIVFQGEKLQPVLTAWHIARFSQVLVKQNFILAILYNVVAIPLAVAGIVTPLIAAIAMSSSSLLVIANALRLNLLKEKAL